MPGAHEEAQAPSVPVRKPQEGGKTLMSARGTMPRSRSLDDFRPEDLAAERRADFSARWHASADGAGAPVPEQKSFTTVRHRRRYHHSWTRACKIAQEDAAWIRPKVSERRQAAIKSAWRKGVLGRDVGRAGLRFGFRESQKDFFMVHFDVVECDADADADGSLYSPSELSSAVAPSGRSEPPSRSESPAAEDIVERRQRFLSVRRINATSAVAASLDASVATPGKTSWKHNLASKLNAALRRNKERSRDTSGILSAMGTNPTNSTDSSTPSSPSAKSRWARLPSSSGSPLAALTPRKLKPLLANTGRLTRLGSDPETRYETQYTRGRNGPANA